MDQDQFTDATLDGTLAAVCEDGEHVLLTVDASGTGAASSTIALTASQARRMARVLNMYAESV